MDVASDKWRYKCPLHPGGKQSSDDPVEIGPPPYYHRSDCNICRKQDDLKTGSKLLDVPRPGGYIVEGEHFVAEHAPLQESSAGTLARAEEERRKPSRSGLPGAAAPAYDHVRRGRSDGAQDPRAVRTVLMAACAECHHRLRWTRSAPSSSAMSAAGSCPNRSPTRSTATERTCSAWALESCCSPV
jgi:hypothetical protein